MAVNDVPPLVCPSFSPQAIYSDRTLYKYFILSYSMDVVSSLFTSLFHSQSLAKPASSIRLGYFNISTQNHGM